MRVTSSVITAMSYREKEQLLTVTYQAGKGTYRYFDVPPEVWSAFQAAPSKGTYLNQVFKNYGFRFEKRS